LEEEEFRQHVLRQVVPAIEKHFQPQVWQAFWGHAVEGKTAAQVAEELGMTESAVYKAKLRVMAYVHRELADLMED